MVNVGGDNWAPSQTPNNHKPHSTPGRASARWAAHSRLPQAQSLSSCCPRPSSQPSAAQGAARRGSQELVAAWRLVSCLQQLQQNTLQCCKEVGSLSGTQAPARPAAPAQHQAPVDSGLAISKLPLSGLGINSDSITAHAQGFPGPGLTAAHETHWPLTASGGHQSLLSRGGAGYGGRPLLRSQSCLCLHGPPPPPRPGL